MPGRSQQRINCYLSKSMSFCQSGRVTVQGNRVLTKEHLEEVVLDPSGFEALTLEASFEGSLLLQQIEGDLAQDGQVWGAVILADATVIFSKGDVQSPMQVVFDAPMARVASSRVLA